MGTRHGTSPRDEAGEMRTRTSLNLPPNKDRTKMRQDYLNFRESDPLGGVLDEHLADEVLQLRRDGGRLED